MFLLQEKVIEDILRSEKETEAKAAAPKTVDSMQQVVAEELKNALRRSSVDRDAAKEAIRYLGRPMGRFAVKRLKAAHAAWQRDGDDGLLLEAVQALASDFSKSPTAGGKKTDRLMRDDLELVCFEYLSA